MFDPREPSVQFARSGDGYLAYQAFGSGPIDLLVVPGYMSNVGQNWEWPAYAGFLRRLASFARVILFDRRGIGLSDRTLSSVTFEDLADDLGAVLDAAESERAVLLGGAEGGPMCILFAASMPERTTALVLEASYARRAWAPDCPWGITAEQNATILAAYDRDWGRRPLGIHTIAPSAADDVEFRKWYVRAQTFGATPGGARSSYELTLEIDVRSILHTLRVPPLVLHRVDDRAIPVEAGRYLADNIPRAKYVELPGNDHFWFIGDADEILAEVEEFVTGVRPVPDRDRVLATVLVTDIVGSTERAATLGDRRWRELREAHNALVRRALAQFRGREIDTAGDGFLATFDGPARAVRCAETVRAGLRGLDLDVRAGVHTGEIELTGGGVAGIAVHIGARLASAAEPGEILVSSTVRDLTVGSGLAFDDHGRHTLKGVPGEWQLFRVA